MKSARLYNCARCQCQVVICSPCDRGNIYCSAICSKSARTEKHRDSDQVYQKSPRGKQHHAERQRRYRKRKKIKVTDQGSADLPPNDLLPRKPREQITRQAELIHCHFCGKAVLPFLRHGYLRHNRNDQTRFSSWPLGP
jgi:type I site-specific restriction endonuclease